MNVRLLPALVQFVAVFGLASAAWATPITIDFEGDAIGAIPNGFMSSGSPLVSFADTMGANLEIVAGDGSQCFSNCLRVFGDDPSAVRLTFSVLVDSLSVDFGNDDPGFSSPGDVLQITGFLGAVEVGQVRVTMNRDDIMNQTATLLGFGLFDSAEVVYATSAGDPIDLIERLDNFTFNTADVPEPATGILLGLGLAGAALLRRRR